jgi:hypothetical protein
MSRAHQGVLPPTEPQSRLYFKNQPKTCGRCHADKLEQFRASRHYAALMEDRAAPTCTTCHPAMSQRPLYRNIVQNACRTCHGEGNEAELPLVAEQAENALHNLNIAKGLLGWSAIHYEALGWPGDSQSEMEVLAADYDRIVSKIHRFDLARTDAESGEIMRRLQRIFNEAKEGRSAPSDQ